MFDAKIVAISIHLSTARIADQDLQLSKIFHTTALKRRCAISKCARECLSEYENPLDRRFHAEPTCCPKCGPKVFLTERRHLDGNGRESVQKTQMNFKTSKNQDCEIASQSCRQDDGVPTENAIKKTQQLLQTGKIVAVKGIGGFHLVCDARNDAALQTLRERKGRVDKPFAVMCRDLETAKKLCRNK